MAVFKHESDDGMFGFEFDLGNEAVDVARVQELIWNARIALGMFKGENIYNPEHRTTLEESSNPNSSGEHFAEGIESDLSHVRSMLADPRDVVHREKDFAPLFGRFETTLMPVIGVAKHNQWRTVPGIENHMKALQEVITAGREYLKKRGFEETYVGPNKSDWILATPSF